MSDFMTWLGDAARRRVDAGLRREVVANKSEDLLDLAGNDYLGLRQHPAVVAGAVAAAETYGGGAGASRLVTGTLPLHEELEQALCTLTGAPSALVLSNGYMANLSVLTALTDIDTLVISDAHNHASIVDGCRLSRATVEIARHGDVGHVEDLLRQRTQPRALVVVESVFSVLGDGAPIAELAEVTAAHGAVLVVDEAHGLGVRGRNGEGAVAELGLIDLEHLVITATLSKSLASQGGLVLAHPAVREHLVNAARPFVYDTGLAPASAGAALAATELLTATSGLPQRVRANAARLADAASTQTPAGAVLSVAMPSPEAALAAVAAAADAGIRIGCFRPPSTPDGSSRIRLTAHANHAPDELDHAAGVLAGLLADARG